MSDEDKIVIHEEVEPKDTKTVTTDDRGRAYLGGEYSNRENLRIAILEPRQECQHSDCTDPAVGIYEGIVEPADTIRYAACEDHAPDAKPVKEVDQ